MHLFVFSALVFAAPSNPHLDDILTKVQKAWDETASYQCQFVQQVTSKALGTKDDSEGVISVLKPNRLRWEVPGDGSVQILNGKKFTSLRKNRRRGTTTVDIYQDASKSVDTKALQFLSGHVRFRELYEITLLSETDKKVELKFTPKGDASESYIAEIDKASYFLVSLTTESLESTVRTEFRCPSNLRDSKANPKLEQSLFEYKPGSKDVIHTH